MKLNSVHTAHQVMRWSILCCRDHYDRCSGHFHTGCVGPSLVTQAERLSKAWNREEVRFRHDYNDKLLSGLVFLMLADILIFRFVVRVSLLESGGWFGFIFLQVSCLNRYLPEFHLPNFSLSYHNQLSGCRSGKLWLMSISLTINHSIEGIEGLQNRTHLLSHITSDYPWCRGLHTQLNG